MPFTTPLALLGLLFVPAVVAMYLLRLRRRRERRPLDAAVAAARRGRRGQRALAAAPAQPLLLLPAPARPRPRAARRAAVPRAAGGAGPRPGPHHRHLGEHGRDRRAAGPARRRQATPRIDALKDLPAGGKVSVIEAGPDRPDRGQRDVRPRPRPAGDRRDPRRRCARGDLGDALALAQQLAVQSGDAEVLVATDAALAVDADDEGRGAGPRPPGRRRERARNQAIVALAVRTAPSAVTRSVFVSVANLDLEAATRRVEICGDGPPPRDPDDPRSTPSRGPT